MTGWFQTRAFPDTAPISPLRADHGGSVLNSEAGAEEGLNRLWQALTERGLHRDRSITRLRSFDVIETLGRGAMGTVFLAYDRVLERDVAIKTLNGATGRIPLLLKREARAVAKLIHPNIVPIYGLSRDRATNTTFYVMQYVRGANLLSVLAAIPERENAFRSDTESNKTFDINTLAARLRSRKARVNEATEIGIQVASALVHAHARGIFHRDLKPANLLIDHEKVWVADFGLARIVSLNETVRGRLATGIISLDDTFVASRIGTRRYTPPELLQGIVGAKQSDEHRVAEATTHDIYSLGMILYEVCTLRRVYEGNDDAQVAKKIRTAAFVQPRHWNPHVPRDLQTIIAKTIDKDPEHRYTSAADLLEDLERFRSKRPLRARRFDPVKISLRLCQRRPREIVFATAGFLAVGASVFLWNSYRKGVKEKESAISTQLSRISAKLGAAQDASSDRTVLEQVIRDLDDINREANLDFPQFRPLFISLHTQANAKLNDARLVQSLIAVIGRTYTTKDKDETVRQLTQAFNDAGLPPKEVDTVPALTALRNRSPKSTELIGFAFDTAARFSALDATQNEASNRFAELANAVDPNAFRTELRMLSRPGTPTHIAARLDAIMRKTDGLEQLEPLSAILLANALVSQDRPVDAERVLKSCWIRHLDNSWINQTRATFLLAKGDANSRQEAVRLMSQARILQPELGFDLAKTLETIGKLDEAIVVWEQLAKRLPSDFAVKAGLGAALIQSLKRSQALPVLSEAEAGLRARATSQRLDAFDHNALGVVLLATGRIDAAIAEFRASRLPEAHLNLSVALARTDLSKEAIREAELAVSKGKADPDFVDALGGALQSDEQFDQACIRHQVAIDLAPTNTRYFFNLAHAQFQLGQFNKAKKTLQQALALDPEYVAAENLQALIVEKEGQPAKALTHLESLINRRPEFARGWSNIGRLKVSIATSTQNYSLLEEGIAAYRKAAELDPEAADSLTNLGFALLQSRQKNEALDLLKAAVARRPRSFAAQLDLGVAAIEARELPLATQALTRALELKPGHEAASVCLGLALQVLGRQREGLMLADQAAKGGKFRSSRNKHEESVLAGAKRMADLNGRLDDVLGRTVSPNLPHEALELAHMCVAKGWYVDAVELFDKGIAALTTENDDVKLAHRHHAARAALLAATRKDPRGVNISEFDKQRLRRKALEWSIFELTFCRIAVKMWPSECKKYVAWELSLRELDSDFDSVRVDHNPWNLKSGEQLDWWIFWTAQSAVRRLASSL